MHCENHGLKMPMELHICNRMRLGDSQTRLIPLLYCASPWAPQTGNCKSPSNIGKRLEFVPSTPQSLYPILSLLDGQKWFQKKSDLPCYCLVWTHNMLSVRHITNKLQILMNKCFWYIVPLTSPQMVTLSKLEQVWPGCKWVVGLDWNRPM